MEKSQNIYDNDAFFEGYKKIRENKESANETREKPILFKLLPDLKGKRVLDLGCGYGEHCREYKNRGAEYVLGVDLSEKMLQVAKEENPDIDFVRADISDLSFVKEKFDLVCSSLAFHYVEDFEKLMNEIAGVLNDGGYLIFSQEHPITTAPLKGYSWTKDENGNVIHYNLADYMRVGKRKVNWLVDGVVKYHRNMAFIVNAIAQAGFRIENAFETMPDGDPMAEENLYHKEFHKPHFLIFKARKD